MTSVLGAGDGCWRGCRRSSRSICSGPVASAMRECGLYLGGSQHVRLGGRVLGLLTEEGIGWVGSERAKGCQRGRGE